MLLAGPISGEEIGDPEATEWAAEERHTARAQEKWTACCAPETAGGNGLVKTAPLALERTGLNEHAGLSHGHLGSESRQMALVAKESGCLGWRAAIRGKATRTWRM